MTLRAFANPGCLGQSKKITKRNQRYASLPGSFTKSKQKKNTQIFGLHGSFPSSANKAKCRSYKNHCIHSVCLKLDSMSYLREGDKTGLLTMVLPTNSTHTPWFIVSRDEHLRLHKQHNCTRAQNKGWEGPSTEVSRQMNAKIVIWVSPGEPSHALQGGALPRIPLRDEVLKKLWEEEIFYIWLLSWINEYETNSMK